jgi:DNA-binding transcriptional LysR family regulator
MLDLHRLRLLRELAYRGTKAAVAQALSYTPSAVSQQLSILEREAGVALLERTGRRVQLTPAGQILVEHTEHLMAGLERAEAALAATRQGLTGHMRLGAFPSATRTLLPNALVALGRNHPGLDLMVEEYDPVHAAEAVRAGTLDAAMTHDYDLVPVPEHPALESTVVLTEAMLLASNRPPDDPDDPVASFRNGMWILGKAHSLCGLAARRICQVAGFEPQIRHQTDDFPTALALVAAGQGQAILPGLGATNRPRGIVLTPLSVVARVAVTHRRGSGTHPAIAAFRDAVDHSVHRYLATATPANPAGKEVRRRS